MMIKKSDAEFPGVLVLVQNQQEAEAAIRSGDSSKQIILGILPTRPFLTNEWSRLNGVHTWQAWGVPEFSINRYWLNDYRAIESVIANALKHSDYSENPMVMNPHFMMDLVMFMGKHYFEPVRLLDEFFQAYPVREVFTGEITGFLKDYLLRLSEIHKFELKEIAA